MHCFRIARSAIAVHCDYVWRLGAISFEGHCYLLNQNQTAEEKSLMSQVGGGWYID